MKVGVVGDIHWSRYSSILRQKGHTYSCRLENCIESVRWAEGLIGYHKCDMAIYLGDFFDSSELNSEELTALTELTDVWGKNFGHYFLVGNHEMGIHDLSQSSSHIFNMLNVPTVQKMEVVDKPLSIECDTMNLVLLPYILEDERKPLKKYIKFIDNNKRNIVFSHNDIAGIQMGKFKSQKGFSIEEIQENCDLFLNGHIHNGEKVADKIINVGNLTGQNFSEDATKYDHGIIILDTETLQCEFYENPHAFNFYKFDLCNLDYALSNLKTNSVVTGKVMSDKQEFYKEQFENDPNIIAYRIILAPSESTDTVSNNREIISVNHLEKFSEYVLQNLGNDNVVKYELEEVLK